MVVRRMQCIILSVHMHLKGLGIQFVLATFQRIAKHLEVGRAANPYFLFPGTLALGPLSVTAIDGDAFHPVQVL